MGRKLYKRFLPLVFLFGLSACALTKSDGGQDSEIDMSVETETRAEVEFVRFNSMERLANGDVMLKSADAEITVPAESFASGRSYKGVAFDFFDVESYVGGVVSFKSDTVEVAGGAIRAPEIPITGVNAFMGLIGTTTAPPTSGSTSYLGAWSVIGVDTERGFTFVEGGDLAITYDFGDMSVNGAGSDTSDNADAFTLVGTANANGSISGDVSIDLGFVTGSGEAEGGFFGDDSAEIAGTFSGDKIGGAFLTTRQP